MLPGRGQHGEDPEHDVHHRRHDDGRSDPRRRDVRGAPEDAHGHGVRSEVSTKVLLQRIAESEIVERFDWVKFDNERDGRDAGGCCRGEVGNEGWMEFDSSFPHEALDVGDDATQASKSSSEAEEGCAAGEATEQKCKDQGDCSARKLQAAESECCESIFLTDVAWTPPMSAPQPPHSVEAHAFATSTPSASAPTEALGVVLPGSSSGPAPPPSTPASFAEQQQHASYIRPVTALLPGTTERVLSDITDGSAAVPHPVSEGPTTHKSTPLPVDRGRRGGGFIGGCFPCGSGGTGVGRHRQGNTGPKWPIRELQFDRKQR